MLIVRFLIVLLFSTTCFVSVSQAETYRCETLFPKDGDIHLQASSEFRVIPGEPFLSFRGSVAHFWRWLKQQANDSQAAPLLSYLGHVVGDFHPGNWGDIELKHPKNFRKTGLIDLDDVGIRGALLGDFIRGATGVQLSGIDMTPEKLWDAYVLGLKGRRVAKPTRLEKIQKKAIEDFDKRQIEYLQELIENNSQFKSGGPILPLAEAPYLARQLFKTMRPEFQRIFYDYNILDVGFRMKLIGGSQRLPRYMFLLESLRTGERRVVEAKYLVAPGTSEFANQGSHSVRIAIAGGLFRPEDTPVGFYDVLETPEHTFQIRERFDNYIDFDPIKMQKKLEPAELEKSLLYIFNQMGRFQIRQDIAVSLLAAIRKNPDINTNGVKDLIQQYVAEAFKRSTAPDVAK